MPGVLVQRSGPPGVSLEMPDSHWASLGAELTGKLWSSPELEHPGAKVRKQRPLVASAETPASLFRAADLVSPVPSFSTKPWTRKQGLSPCPFFWEMAVRRELPLQDRVFFLADNIINHIKHRRKSSVELLG